jgi:phosphate transport system permease protein
MATSTVSIRAQISAASSRIRRVRRLDRLAAIVIRLGGVGVVLAVLGILGFVIREALPLFASATLAASGERPLHGAVERDVAGAAGVDEYRTYLYTVDPAGAVVVHRTATGEQVQTLPVPEVGGARVTAAARTLTGHHVAAGLSDGRVSLFQVQFVPQYRGSTLADLTITVRARGAALVDDERRPLRQISYAEQEGGRFVAAITDAGGLVLWWTGDDGAEHRARLDASGSGRVTHVRVGRNGTGLAGTDTGRVLHWAIGDRPELTDTAVVSEAPVTALEWILGGRTWVAATGDGALSAWSRVPIGSSDSLAMARTHVFTAQRAAVTAIAPSSRDRSFVTVGRDGELILRHQTSERVLARAESAPGTLAAIVAPKADGLLTIDGTRLRTFDLDNPHPEISWTTLFGGVWYEGYAGREHVWQSTGATDDFEPKFGLVPLVFGTIKGTLYAMIFAVPLAVLGALYTSQFTAPIMRGRLKSTVEIMAALPSVVIGFLAGLYLAGLVERHLVTVLLVLLLLPLAGVAGVAAWRLLPARVTTPARAGVELVVIVPLLLLGIWAAAAIAPTVEQYVLGGDARLWLQQTWGLSYDQRNCLVVGIAMGFAIVPIIFTISEDAFSSVPASLTAASLALGASAWQTALRIVVPTASPGVFSAIMVGFGRAVGETMIVLMATGNTPIMDWSIFNGIRTLSANIAVEIPEAPYGGTLYRTLFLAAALLFVMTFVLNTVAEVIRQRLRQRFRAA